MARILVVTLFNNEVDNIKGLVDNIANQTIRPSEWLLLDDGSVDGSIFKFIEHCRNRFIPTISFRMPYKRDGPDPNTKGRAFRDCEILKDIHGYDYILKIDADSRLPVDMIKELVQWMEENPDYGVIAPQIAGEPKRSIPMGTAKLVRWSVVEETNKHCWDLDPDTLWNIKALRMGLKLKCIDNEIETTRRSSLTDSKGRYLFGQRMYYVGCNPILVLARAFKYAFKRNHAVSFLKGYFHELRKRDWRYEDPDVQYFYSLRRMIKKRW